MGILQADKRRRICQIEEMEYLRALGCENEGTAIGLVWMAVKLM